MTKPSTDPREQQQREDQQVQQDINKNRQKAEEAETAGRHNQDGIKDHQGADKGPRGQ